MYQSEYDELKELIYRLKQYVDYQTVKTRRVSFHDIYKATYGESLMSEAEHLAALYKGLHEINLEMVKKGIITQNSITEPIINMDGVGMGPTMFPNLKQKGENDI